MKILLYPLAVGWLALMSCHKFLDKPYDGSLKIPRTIPDMQATLDQADIMNGMSSGQMGVVPALGEAACDDYYLLGFPKLTVTPALQNLYTWRDDTTIFYDWAYGYRAIRYANTVLDGARDIHPSPTELPSYNNAKGGALFYRAYMYYQLAQIYTPPYSNVTADKPGQGLALKFRSDVNEILQRSSLRESYAQILKDAREAKDLLPVSSLGGLVTRPSKPAALALLAKTFLIMHQYDSAFYYSDECLKLKNDLLDYNDSTAANPAGALAFSQFNKEVIFHSCLIQTKIGSLFSSVRYRIDSSLYQMYDQNDLRKKIFFGNSSIGKSFRGSYDGSHTLFGGIATDEVYLIRAECNVRNGHMSDGIKDLETLLNKRWKTGTFHAPAISDPVSALQIILDERRKELLCRGIRWTDLRRLNGEGANIILHRWFDGQPFTLYAHAPQYTFLIPSDAIGNMPQNAR